MEASPRDPAEIEADAEKLVDIIAVLQRCFLTNLCSQLSKGNVSFPQYFLLGFLANHKPLTMTEIAAQMGHTTAAATGLVDRLVALGHVRRSPAKDDRRKIMVEITDGGRGLVSEIRGDMVTNVKKVMLKLTSEEQKAWLQIYGKIHSFCQAGPAES